MKRILICLLAIASLLGCCACSASDKGKNDNNALATAEVTSAAVPTPTPSPTIVPSLMEMGLDGVFEDAYITATFPQGLVYDSSPAYNCAYYTTEYFTETLAMTYLPDESCVYSKEFGNYNYDSYAKYVWHTWSASLSAFKYTEVDGHEALRTVIKYTNSSGSQALTLAYHINVNGWALTIYFTTTSSEIPKECDEAVRTIRFKDGY